MRIVVTGIGLVTPLGGNVDSTWKRLLDGESGISRINTFDASEFKSQIAGQVQQDDDFFNEWVPLKDRKKIGRFILLGVTAAGQALKDAQWAPSESKNPERTGVLIGSGVGGLPEIEQTSLLLNENGPSRVSPFFIPSALINLSSGYVSIRFGCKGPNVAIVTACSSGAHAIGEAAEIIRRGDADVMIAGGAEAAICPIGVAGFSAMKALSSRKNHEPTKASCPWDLSRDGFVIGEGSGIMILESLDHAKKRGAKIYAEIVGYGSSGDAYHIAAPQEEGEGAYRCMQMALKHANLKPDDIGYINAHGTSTKPGDLAELRAIERLFTTATKISSTKSSIGHLLGAAGSVEAIFSILSLNTGWLPPTLNLNDPEQTDFDLIPHVAKHVCDLQHVLSNSFGFGGTNASLIFGKYDNAQSD